MTEYDEYKQTVIRFLMEGFFEIFISFCVGFKLYELKELWTTADSVNFILQMISIFILLVFIFVSIHFLFCRQPKLVKEHIRVRNITFKNYARLQTVV